jgi:hypothetical protein
LAEVAPGDPNVPDSLVGVEPRARVESLGIKLSPIHNHLKAGNDRITEQMHRRRD